MDRWKEDQARLDRRSGEVVAMLYNINRDRDKDPEGKGWADFYPTHRRELPAQSDEEMFVSMQVWAAMTQRAVPRS